MPMEPEVEARFERIESILHAMVERENRMEIRFDQQHAKAMQRLDQHEKQIKATANLVRAGMKIVLQLGREVRETRAEMREMRAETREMKAEMRQIARRQDAFLRAFRNGGNGHK